MDYFLGDALGSVRQLADGNGEVTLAKSYQPFGETLSSAGDGESAFAFTGEAVDSTGLVYLRARYLDPAQGRFISRDTWDGDYNRSLSLNKWLYALANPINFRDPTGLISCGNSNDALCINRAKELHIFALVVKNMVRDGDLLPVEGFATFVDIAMRHFDNDVKGMMWGVSNVLLGIDPNEHAFVWFGVPFPVYGGNGKNNPYFVGQNWLPYKNDPDKDDETTDPPHIHSERGDWRPEYWDDTPNQAYHFWYSVAVTYYDGDIWADLADIVHDPYFLECVLGDDLEMVRTVPKVGNRLGGLFTGTSQQDFLLAAKGIPGQTHLNWELRQTGKNLE